MRGGNGGDARAVNNTLDTINAAATAIASVNNRLNQPLPHFQKKTWGSWLSIYWCFGHRKNQKRIGHAVLVPVSTPSGADVTAATVGSTQAPSIPFPFAAPPSSPASFLHSEPPSVSQSPGGILSLTSVSASMYSPGGPFSIFAIGPYAHETQLVSPPVFSTFTTEPSTAPFTPPPESLHLTTPSSPEVPFAQLLHPNNKNPDTYQRFQISQYDFLSYHLHPGSPVAQLISPRSAFSTSATSSPFRDADFSSRGRHKSRQGSGSLTPDSTRSTTQAGFLPSHWVTEINRSPHPRKTRPNEISINHSLSIEVSAQEVLKCVENKAGAWTKSLPFKTDIQGAEKEDNSREVLVSKTQNDVPQQIPEHGDVESVHHKDESITFSSAKEFNFDNAEGGDSPGPNLVVDWWANEKVSSKEGGSSKNWSFFPQ
ncbi:hypothetical protein PHAVU_002G158200 [Phaseolus vulgaris]|uniref:Hydroxyproline-rich glycoprotein family protein n=1 Tax=Phaseolus vulgaris TaxID=3885 RepID=V7CJX8_PHAVU|nr:hypothetical protein PHAVU_002G158200g [Phaseolus vulgaris]ESW30502.1 hypothetical protein PHAVU_002G158200g [Phaseolus vulgaris]